MGLVVLVACTGTQGHLTPVVREEGPEVVGGEPLPADPIEAIPRSLPNIRENGIGNIERPNGSALFRPGVIQELEIELSESALASLAAEPEVQVEGTLVWREEPMTVAIRLKGSRSRRGVHEKAAFKIDVHEYDREQEIDGLERITLNNMVQDASMLREHAYYWASARLGQPAPRHGFANVTVNGQLYGVYGLLETVDEQFLGRVYPDDRDGNLYEADPADFTDAHDWFDLEEDGGVVPVWDDLDDLVDAVEDAEDFDEMLREEFDRDAILDFLALDMVAGNSDGYVYNFHNHLPYHRPIEDKWVIVPWGTDQAFKLTSEPLGTAEKPAEGHLFLQCWAHPVCGPDLRERARNVLDLFEDELLPMLDEAEQLIEPACEEDPRREKSCQPEDVAEYVEARIAFLRPLL